MVLCQQPRFESKPVRQIIYLWRNGYAWIYRILRLHSLTTYLRFLFAGSDRGPGAFGLLPCVFEFPRSARGAAVEFDAELPGGCVVPASPDELVGAVTPLRDLMYATSETSCSSVTCPLNVGIIGWKPSTIWPLGFSIDSRM